MAASSRFVRASKFRHVFCEPDKADDQYLDLDLGTHTGDHFYVSASTKFFSVAGRGGGGKVFAIPFEQHGKVGLAQPAILGHSGNVYDTQWSPFNDNLLATASADSTVKIWTVPDGGLKENLVDPLITLNGHSKDVTLVQFHPSADNVLASASRDATVKIWDCETGEAKTTIASPNLLSDVRWNYNGSQIAVSCKDKFCRIYDPRSGAVAGEMTPHEGAKVFNVVFLGSREQILTAGFTRQSKREFKVWDPRNLTAPLFSQELDQSAGVMMPFYDDDTRMLYLGGKGDGNIRYYEFVDEAPFVYFLSEYRTSESTNGMAMLPKRAVDTRRVEIARFLKLTGKKVVGLSFIVPRKSEAFQDDLYPDAASGEPALTAAAWFAGTDRAPKTISLNPEVNGGVTGGASTFRARPVAPAPAPAPAPSAAGGGGGGGGGGSAAAPAPAPAPAAPAVGPKTGKTAEELERELEEAHARITELELEIARARGEEA